MCRRRRRPPRSGGPSTPCGGKESRRLNLHGLMGRDPAFLELVDLHSTFPKILGIMGFNIQLFHTQLVVTPPDPGGPSAERKKLSFHQDNNRMSRGKGFADLSPAGEPNHIHHCV